MDRRAIHASNTELCTSAPRNMLKSTVTNVDDGLNIGYPAPGQLASYSRLSFMAIDVIFIDCA